jgi:hypothetical protein
MSLYTTPFRRFTLRLDGFASVHAGADSGEVVTHPLRFAGRELTVNCSTSAGGGVRVEIQDAAGKPLPRFAAEDCQEIIGDAVERKVRWKGSSDVGSLAGQPVRLRFLMKDADLYSLRFADGD